MSPVLGGNWTCHVCGRSRADETISVARHIHIDANGIRVEENVRHCNDSETCIRAARARSHTHLAYQRLAREHDAVQSLLQGAQEKLLWQRSFAAITAFVAGFIVRGVF